jgi:CRP/FNR family transcriptional regulator, cyclic AMP receptor protein
MSCAQVFCGLSAGALEALDSLKCALEFPKRALLFLEGQAPSGVFVLCKGSVKMSICARDGKTLIPNIAQPGEILGLSAALSGKPYELSAETMEPCAVSFVKRNDFLRFLKEHPEACFKVVEHLGTKYQTACREVRWLGLRHADQRVARLLLDWSSENNDAGERTLKLLLTQEEIGELIGATRMTVNRVFADLKKQRIVAGRGTALIIRDPNRLREMTALSPDLAN